MIGQFARCSVVLWHGSAVQLNWESHLMTWDETLKIVHQCTKEATSRAAVGIAKCKCQGTLQIDGRGMLPYLGNLNRRNWGVHLGSYIVYLQGNSCWPTLSILFIWTRLRYPLVQHDSLIILVAIRWLVGNYGYCGPLFDKKYTNTRSKLIQL